MTGFPHLDAPADGYVFVVTYGRSGSTLIQNLLNALPGYCIRGENAGTLLHLHDACHAIGASDAMRGHIRTGHPTGPAAPWYGAERVDPRRYARALADTFVRECLTLPPGTRVGGFKEIRHGLKPDRLAAYLDFLLDVFPRARIVFNTRALDGLVRSGWWKDMAPERVARNVTGTEAGFADCAARHPGRTVTLHYDDYVADPARLTPLFDLLGEPFDPALAARVLGTRLDHTGV